MGSEDDPPAAADDAEMEAAMLDLTTKKKKKKKKSKNKAATGGGTTEPQKTAAKKVAFDSDDDDDDAPMQPVAPVKKPQPSEPSMFGSGGKLTKQQLADINDGWVVEGAKNQSKKKAAAAKRKAAAAAAAQQSNAAATPSTETKEYITINAKKIGILIGPKGATLHALQDATNTTIETPQNRDRDDTSPAKVIVTGSSPADVKKAKSAIKELCDKGYTSVIEGEGFLENYVSMHPQFLSEIVGPGGSVIKAIQQKLNVKVSIPSTDWKPNNTYTYPVKNVRVGVAGKKEDCVMAKAVINSIVQYHHHEITHPGFVHREVDVPDHFLNYVIGIKGSEIRHIKGNYKCDVYIPNAESYCEHVLVVGRPENADKAVKHIHNLMARASEQSERRYDDEEW
uniref:K Homology domain-containing protein n=1 Tax=Helicotheca tamesis TaxID=374047 RepID=A0A7S2N416_9STRA|mmetsp:Transcript_9037/g.12506  ORF Transcript_9037/g.12506 Transcript_9037/m.12506 type:complete len:396 (+) Transcript_9037:134-1321(+)